MSASRRAGVTRGAGTWAGVAALGVLTVAGVFALGSGAGDAPLDPHSDERLGTSALVALVGQMEGDVTIDDRLPDGGDAAPDVIVLLADRLDADQRVVLDDWIERGGRLVVTDPGSDYAPVTVASFDSVDDLAPPRTLRGACEIDALDAVDVSGIEPRNGGVLYDAVAGAQTCVVGGVGGAYIVATRQGQGTVVAVGGSGLFVNAALAEGQNAPVVTALVAPEPGTHLLVLEPGALAGASGERTLVDLVPSGVKRALAQLGVAFVVYALWRARRLGRPVAEAQPVTVAGSELVVATGNLLDRTRTPAHAAELLRADLRRVLADHVGVPTGSPPDVLATVAADRTGAAEASLRWALGNDPVVDDDGLVALAHTIDRIRKEVLAHV